MKLYEIVEDIRALNALVENLTDDETGETREVTDEEKESFVAWINETSSAFNAKFDAVCKVYRNIRAAADVCTAEKDALKDEYDRLSRRAKAREAESDRVKGLIWFAFDRLKMQKHKTDLFSAGIQNTQYSVKTDMPELLPVEYQKIDTDATAIKEAVKKGVLYQKPVSVINEDWKTGDFVSPLKKDSLFFKSESGEEFELIGVTYKQGKTIVIR
jgi:lipopolysaccharide biosynthesis protein